MFGISWETYEKNSAETIVDSDTILIEQKHVEKRLDHKNLQMTTVKYLSDHRKPIGISTLTKKTTIQQNFNK